MSAEVLPYETIDHVLERMEQVIDRCVRERSRLGYFATLYRDVTVQIRAAILAGVFEDGPRMERLDVIFASRYLDALESFWSGKQPTQSWLVAFQSAVLWRPVVLQHLLLGMHAHINLDLAIAAAKTAPGAELPALKRDFDQITTLLDGMIAGVQQRIERVSPWFRVIDRVGGRTEGRVVGFCIGEARDLSWRAAQRLAVAGHEQFEQEVMLHDGIVALLARGIRSPGPVLSSALEIVRVREANNVPAVIAALRMEQGKAS